MRLDRGRLRAHDLADSMDGARYRYRSRSRCRDWRRVPLIGRRGIGGRQFVHRAVARRS